MIIPVISLNNQRPLVKIWYNYHSLEILHAGSILYTNHCVHGCTNPSLRYSGVTCRIAYLLDFQLGSLRLLPLRLIYLRLFNLLIYKYGMEDLLYVLWTLFLYEKNWKFFFKKYASQNNSTHNIPYIKVLNFRLYLMKSVFSVLERLK